MGSVLTCALVIVCTNTCSSYGHSPRACVQVIVAEVNTQFVENVIFIMKNIMENKVEGHTDHLGIASIEPLMLAIVK